MLVVDRLSCGEADEHSIPNIGTRKIPRPDSDGLIPPVVFGEGDRPGRYSPYSAPLDDIEALFAYSPERQRRFALAREFRDALTRLPLRVGCQWLSGSLLERCDGPLDLDVHTFYVPPRKLVGRRATEAFMTQHADLFDRKRVLARYGLEPHYLPLTSHPLVLTGVASMALTRASYSPRTGKMRGIVVTPGFNLTTLEPETALDGREPEREYDD